MKRAFIAAAILVLAAFAGIAAVNNGDASAVANYSISGDSASTATGGTLEFDIVFDETDEYSTISITYEAKLLNSSDTTQSNAVSPSTGSLVDGVRQKLTVTAPKSSGTYTLSVVFTEQIDDKDARTFTSTQKINVVEPIKLSLTVKNNGNVDLNDVTVYFYVDGKIVENSDTKLSVAAGKEATIAYDYGNAGLSHGKHTFTAKAAEGSYLTIAGLGEEQTFYYKQGDYDYMNYAMAAVLVLLIAFCAYVFTRPVKNYGKPKSRR